MYCKNISVIFVLEENAMFSQTEFQTAFRKTADAHRDVSRDLGETVMKKFIERWEINRSKREDLRTNFRDLIRLTLNELNIAPPKRQMYSALIGHYYTQHAQYAKQRRSGVKRPTVKKQPMRLPFGTRAEVSGQLAWEI